MTTVNELIELLQEQVECGNGDKDVLYSYNYGDHWRTTVAEGISDCSEQTVVYSDYHSKDKVVDEDDSPANARQVIILS